MTFRDCTTPEFKLSSGKLMQFILLRHCFLLLVCVVLVGLLLIVVGLMADFRFSVAGLMVWCIILPGTMAFCFFRYGLKSVNALNCIRHTLHFTEHGIELIYFKPIFIAEKESKEQENEVEDGRVEDELLVEEEPTVIFYKSEQMGRSESFGNGLFVEVNTRDGNKDGYLYIPYSGKNDEAILSNMKQLAKNSIA